MLAKRARKERLLDLVEEGEPHAAVRFREITARLRALAARPRADARAIRAEAAAWLKQIRGAAAAGNVEALAPPTVNANLSRLRPLIVAAVWDRETRTVEINLTPWRGTGFALVPPSSRGSYSGSSVPWRARASRRAARLKT